MLTKSNVSSFSLIPILFVLTLFLLLSVLSVSVILAGSSVYDKISVDMDGNYDRRVTFSYFTTKFRQCDSVGNISIEEKDGVNMIAIKEKYDASEVTYIYYYDGYIREIPVESGGAIEFDLDWGEEIIKAEGFEFQFFENERKIEMSLKDREGEIQSTKIFLRSHN